MGDFDDFLAFIILLLGAAVVIKIIDDATKSTRYECPNCGTILSKGTSPCPKCGTPLRWL
ncbi:rubrerythrin-like domain-containing protein [Candidatus Bathyarchaeota archaeon]|nr:rubrerythrin-like domain-containing protein [Candidatus Bathyarchaeota archaeon]